jgi:diamine N-acetyltransferase
MQDIRIEKAVPTDVARLQKIGRSTFYETFASVNTEEDMQHYLNESFHADKLSRELANPDSEFYFALSAAAIIGYLKLNTGQAQTERRDKNALEIERIYVLKAYHGKKVGQALYDMALQRARARRVAYVWLGVWEKNLRAISFYEKNGFTAFDKHSFTLGHDVQTDIMMRLRLD